MITQSKPEPASTTRDFFRIVFRHKLKVIACFALTMGIAAAVVFFWPRSYKSVSMLFVHVGRETVTLDPTATTGQVIPVSLSRKTEVNSVLEMLRSRVVIEKLVDEIGPAAFLRPSDRESGATESESLLSRLFSIANVDPVSEREKAIDRAERCVNLVLAKKSDVISVCGTAGSPQLAQHIVAKFVDIYLGEHARMHRTNGSQAFFTEQTALLQKNLSGALVKLRDAKNELGIMSVESQRLMLQDETVAVENKLSQSRAALAASRDKVEALRQRVEVLPERLATDEIHGFPNAAADCMRQDLYQLEIREAELASRYTANFPVLAALRTQIEVAKKPLDKEEHRRTQQTTGVSLVHDQLQLSLLSEESNLASLDAETKSLDKQLAQLHDRTRKLNDHEIQIAKLEQEVSLHKANFATYSEKSEQSRIDSALQTERITNVNVIQPANLVAKPVNPHKAEVLTLGLLGGIVLGIGAALLAEFFDPSLKTSDDVEESLSLPVLVTIPRVAKRHMMAK